MTPEFNLIEEPWIPCIDTTGNRVEFGIRDTLAKAHELREICDGSPLVTVSIHRLLLALLYRAFQGPTGLQSWKTLWQMGSFAGNTDIEDYLGKWLDRFWLFHDQHPFYQMAGLNTRAESSVSRLATEAASGNNATLFEHSRDETRPEWSFGMGARMLVAAQSFALGFGKSGNATINGRQEQLPYSADGIALRGMTVWLEGTNLFQTMMANLVPSDDQSSPPWERPDSNQYRDKLIGTSRTSISAFGTVDRFTWQSRLIRLVPHSERVSTMHFTQGRSADKSTGDPMKVYRSTKEEGVAPLPLSSGKAAWRDAHAMFAIPSAKSNERRPECFNMVSRAGLTGSFCVRVVGLASAPTKAAKFLLWRHERMPVPVALLNDVNVIERLGSLIQKAEQAGNALNKRIRRIAELYLSPTAGNPGGRQPDKDDVTKLVDDLDPRPAYWARMEQHFFELLEGLPNDWDTQQGQWKPDDLQTATRTWRDQVKREARRALEESIRQLGTTARAIQAVARVRTDFSDDDLKLSAQKAATGSAKGGTKK